MPVSTFWSNRIKSANKEYITWSRRFKCNALEQYYEGNQHGLSNYFTAASPYFVNLVYAEIKTQEANLLLSYPEFLITPRPGNMDWNEEYAVLSAALKQDVLNTIISDDKEAMAEIMQLCYLDSMFRFGVMEVGYANDWLRNPLASVPLREDQVTNIGKEDKEIKDKPKIDSLPRELPDNEKVYFKHISAKRFRVGSHDNILRLHRSDWFGYYDFVLRKDLQVIDGIKSDTLKNIPAAGGSEANEYTSKRYIGEEDEKGYGDVIKVWHAWDPRALRRFLILDNPCEPIWSENYKRTPIVDLRWDLRLSTWYPIPPVFQWLSPQNEYNESREMMRNHRKRFVRKFGISEDLDAEERDKFTSGEDGALVVLPRPDAIKAIENPPLDTIGQDLVVTTGDFNLVAGRANADRGKSDRTTATESQRIALKADVRDAASDYFISRMMTRAGREALLIMRDRFETGVWAQLTQDPGEEILGPETQQPQYQWVSQEILDDGYDFKINVNIISGAPQKMQDEQAKFITFLSLVSKFPQVQLSPMLIRECAYRSGYRNERVIKEMQKMAMLTAMGQAAMAQGQANAQGADGTAQQIVASKTPPQQEEIGNQLDKQIL